MICWKGLLTVHRCAREAVEGQYWCADHLGGDAGAHARAEERRHPPREIVRCDVEGPR